MKTYNAIVYVKEMAASVAFYEALLGAPPVEASPNFSLFVLPGGILLGLWAKADVVPSGGLVAGGVELFWPVDSREEVEALFSTWKTRGVQVELPPADMEFGYNFVALDLDGLRLRVCHLKQG